ncbi:MAG: spore coat protein CotJB [Clostridiaceae bacterium]|nr:spore coat protein CotJB [Clostridiaceae bacterium]
MNNQLKCVMEEGLVMLDLALYLDTHPTCPNGLAAYCAAKDRYAAACAAYESSCGPLTKATAGGDTCWTWVQWPWPWEVEA